MKRIISVFMAAVFCLTLSLPALAEEERCFIVDEIDCLDADERQSLDNKAGRIFDYCGIGACFIALETLRADSPDDYIDSVYASVCPADDAVVLIYEKDAGKLYLRFLGDGARAVYGHEEELLRVWSDADTYYGGAAAYIELIGDIVGVTAAVDGAAEETDESVILGQSMVRRLVDTEGLLSSEEAGRLSDKLDEISERQRFDVVVVTVYSLGFKSAEEYADDYYDYNGYGQGGGRDGALLLVSMEDRDWYISTCGFGLTAITDAGLEAMSERFVPYLSDGEYYEAFSAYAELCDSFVSRAREGDPYDRDNLSELPDIPRTPEDWFFAIAVSVVIGLVVALIVCSVLKGKLKSVRMKGDAGDYTVKDSLMITQSSEFYLYSHVTRTAKPKNNDSSGSHSHVSSSGSVHGGGGGKF